MKLLGWGLLALIACTPPPEPCLRGTGVGGDFDAGAPAPPLGVAGKPFALALMQPPFTRCPPKLIEVFTEVLDPLNREVVHSHVESVGEFQLTLTTIAFTPSIPGGYHVSARFEPSIGTTQIDLQIAVDRSDAGSKIFALGAQCSALEVLPSGRVLCLTSADVKLRVYRDDVLLQVLDADDFATAGNVVWTNFKGILERRVDLGGAMPLGGQMSFDPKFAIPNSLVGTLVGLENTAALMTLDQTVMIEVDAGTLSEVDRLSFGTSSTGSVVHAREDLSALLWSSGPRNQIAAISHLCSTPLPNVLKTPVCKAIAVGVVGLGADWTGLWSRNVRGLQHDRLATDAGIQTTAIISVGFPSPASSTRHFPNTPVFSSGNRGIVPHFENGTISLEAFIAEPGFVFMPSSSTTVRAQHPDGRQQLITR